MQLNFKENSNMKRLVPCLLLFVLAVSMIGAAQSGNTFVTMATTGSDYCSNPSVAKTSVAVNISGAAGVHAIVSGVAGQNVYVCGFLASVIGTTPSIQFTAGTKTTTDCDTGVTQQSGAIVVPTTTIVNWAGSSERLVAMGVTSKDLCITAGGTTPSIQGTMVYVQR